MVISVEGFSDLDHAWKLHPRCVPKTDDPTQMEWRATVTPGFVNGRDATISEDRLDPDTLKLKSTEVPLTDEEPPSLVLTGWRNPVASSGLSIDDDGNLVYGAGEGYPAFFDDKGVRKPAAGGDSPDSPDSPGYNREIRALDVFLATPRIATRTQIDVESAAVDSQNVSISTILIDDYARSAPAQYRLLTAAKWQPPREPDLVERMTGTAVEPQTDELRIATVWMLSPSDAGEEAVPDETWTPYVQHFVFWNLMHAARNQLPPADTSPTLKLVTGLAAGVGDALISSLLSPLNDAYAQITAFFAAADLKGEYWNV